MLWSQFGGHLSNHHLSHLMVFIHKYTTNGTTKFHEFQVSEEDLMKIKNKIIGIFKQKIGSTLNNEAGPKEIEN